MTLLFKPHHVPLILSGRKTQTRRLWKKNRVKVGGEYWASTKLFDKSARFARLRVKRVWREYVNAISVEDAYAEGYDSQLEFWHAFQSINFGRSVQLNPIVTAIEFEVIVARP